MKRGFKSAFGGLLDLVYIYKYIYIYISINIYIYIYILVWICPFNGQGVVDSVDQ